MIKMSVVIHTLNEQDNIRNCLETARWADEIVIIDMHSTDKTIDICKEYTDKIYQVEAHEFVGATRYFGLSKTSNEWVFILDADERIPGKLAEFLKSTIREDWPYDSVLIPRSNYFFGRHIRYAGFDEMHVKCLKKQIYKHTDRIHKDFPIPTKNTYRGIVSDPVKKNEMSLIHFPYQSVKQFITKSNPYTTVEARELYDDKHIFLWIELLYKPLSEFYHRYILLEGCRDGIHGFMVSLLLAVYRFMVYVKLWDITENSLTGQKYSQIEKDLIDEHRRQKP